MTFLELCEKLRKRTGTGGGEMTDVTGLSGALARLTDYVNDAWVTIQASRRDWSFRWGEFASTLNSGSQVYDMDSIIGSSIIKNIQPAILTLEKATDTNSRARLTLMDYQYFEDTFGHSPAASGRPVYVTIEPPGKKVKFNTTLDVNYILRGKYQKILQELSSKDDTPTLPDEYHLAIFWLALRMWAEFEEADLIYKLADREFENWQTRMVNDLVPKVLVGGDALA